MKFHEYRDAPYKKSQSTFPHLDGMSALEELRQAIDEDKDSDKLYNTGVWLSYLWRGNDRPFYNVWPNVLECLGRTKLEFSPMDANVYTRGPLSICFPVGGEPKYGGHRVSSALISFTPKTYIIDSDTEIASPALTFVIEVVENEYGVVIGSYGLKSDSALISEMFSSWSSNESSFFSIVFGILLLAKDERFAEPILLNRDAKRKFKSKEDYDRAVARAKRNGRNGMAIGKDIEISPHFRRPHMAIRWTGEGRRIPRLVPVTGCVVSRKHLYPVPTGYMDKERKEAEIG